MNVNAKKTKTFQTGAPLQSHNSNFTPTKRFLTTSPATIISSAKTELITQDTIQNLKKPVIKTPVSNTNLIKTLKSPLTATESRSNHNKQDSLLQRIKETNERKIGRFSDDIMTLSPKPPVKGKEVILDLINLEEKSKAFKMKRLEAWEKPSEEKKKQSDDEFEDSKNSVKSLQKSFRIRNRRSTSDIREKSLRIDKPIDNQRVIDMKTQIKVNVANMTNKHLLHNKMQRRPDTTGAKNREKIFVIIEKTQKTTNFEEGNNNSSGNLKLAENVRKISGPEMKNNNENNEKNRVIFKKEEISVIKEKFKEEFIEKLRLDKREEENGNHNNPLDIKKEFSTDLFDEFKFGELLGEGAYAQVFKVLLPKKGNFIAVKVIKLIKGSDERCAEQLKGLRNEINLLQRLNHPHIVSYLGCKQQKDNFYIFMEHLSGGSISSMLKQYGRFDEQVIRKFVRQLLLGLEYLHSQGVVHSDLKGANILSDGCGNVKVADFGASRHLENLPVLSVTGSSYIEKSAKGSLYWMAPEILNQEKHGRKIDIWSLGCTVIEMASAKHPWPDCKSFTELVVQVMTLKCPPIPESLSEDCKDFIKQCCIFDKSARPNAKELFSHPFLKEN